jgi:hypothetical protein
MLIIYITTYATVTSAPTTESAVGAAATSKSPFWETDHWPLPLNPAPPYAETQDVNPSYFYPYARIPYYDDPRSRFYYPLNGYQNRVNGYPQTAPNYNSIYPQYGYQIQSGYPYGTGYQYPSIYY